MPDLPQPVSVTDEYLAAIHGALVEIRDRLPEAKQHPKPGQTRVSEPAKKATRAPRKKTSISE